MTHHLSIDLETYSEAPIAKTGAQRYVADPSFEILLFAYSVDGSPVQIIDMAQGEEVPQWLMCALQSKDYIKHAYNAPFEFACLSKRWGPLAPSQWRCTMFHGLYCGYTAGLDATGKALGLPEDKQKLNTDKALIRYFCVPCKPTKTNGQRTRNYPHHDLDKWNLFKEYCCQDVVTEMEIERRLSAFPVPDFVQKQWETDLTINTRGVAVDMPFVQGALQIGDEVRTELMEEARKITELDNPNSVRQVMDWLNKTSEDVELTDLRKDTVSKMLENDDIPDGRDDVRRMLQIRQELGKTSTKKYDVISACVCPDGRVRGLLQFYGANRTGRWAGRLVQVQNLPRTYTKAIETARELVKGGKKDALRVIYGSVPDTLSQLIRTAFVASPENKLIDADFSAIEARVISWLAGETWRLEVFRTHGKIYEASAPQMFGVPLERIKKGNPEYALRAKGKVAELALGYQGSAGALKAMGALDMGLSEEELPEIVDRWRNANPHIRSLWWEMDKAATQIIQEGGAARVRYVTLAREYDPVQGVSCLTIALPSKRKLYYINPQIGENRFGGTSITYMGMDQSTKKWKRIETYGGKLTENCIAEGTQVLTDNGWKPIETVQITDCLWDGIEWVRHDGLISKGRLDAISVDGVYMTPDHKILTQEGWRDASQSERYYRYEVKLPDSCKLYGLRWKKVLVEIPMRLRERSNYARNGIFKRKNEVMWLHEIQADLRSKEYAWNVQNGYLCCVALNERAVYMPYSTGVEQLWRTWNNCMREMAGEFRQFLCRYGKQLSARSYSGQDRCERKLLTRKLQVGHGENTKQEQTRECLSGYALGSNNGSRSIREIRNRRNDSVVQDSARMAERYDVHKTRCTKPVYDLLNAGPRHYYTIMSSKGPMIVHNCVQAIARDALAEAIERLEAKGFPIVFHVHDEVVIDTKPFADDKAMLKTVTDIMTQPLSWAPDLPLGADGWVGDFFTKD